MSDAEELMNASETHGTKSNLITGKDASNYIESVLKKFKPFKTTGHLSIGKYSKSIKTEEHEFSYSKKLPKEAAYIFFDQESKDRNTLVIIKEGSQLCNIMENAYGMEYFVSNKELDYLIAVNWYTIEGAGLAKNWLSELAKE